MNYTLTHASMESGFVTIGSAENLHNAMIKAKKLSIEYPGLVSIYKKNTQGKRILKGQFYKGKQTVFTTEEVRQAGITLEPMICKYCGDTKNVVFNQKLRSGHCEKCGRWQ